MTIQLHKPDITELKPRISVFGVGGGGGNAVNNMINAGLQGVEFVVANTDAQALTMSRADRRIQLGVNATDGLGAGSHPEIGREAAEECLDEIIDHLGNSHMVFVTAGMGGGTGTGAAPVIARAAREKGILTVGVVTKPFHFEGQRRMKTAESGIEELQKNVDTLIIIPNQNLFRIANENTTFADAFSMADQVLYSGVASITDLMVREGLVNLDFADVRSVMQKMGKAMMGTGEASDTGRALAAAEAAIANPLLDETSMRGARGLLISITGGPDMTLFEVDEAANRIREEVDSDANVIFGAILDEALEGIIRVSVVATGIDARAMERQGVVFAGNIGGISGSALPSETYAPSLAKDSLERESIITASAVSEIYESDAGDEDSDEIEREEENDGENFIAGGSFGNDGRSFPVEAKRVTGGGNAPVSETAQDSSRSPVRGFGMRDRGTGFTEDNAALTRQRAAQPVLGQQNSVKRNERLVFSGSGGDVFAEGGNNEFTPQDSGYSLESVSGARGFIKRLQNFFGSGEDVPARLEPAEGMQFSQRENARDSAGGFGENRMAVFEAGASSVAERSSNIGRAAGSGAAGNARRPNFPARSDNALPGSSARVQGRAVSAEEREEENLEIPAFLRRQSH